MNSTIRHWIMAIRPKTLPAGAAPVILGAALAYEPGRLLWPAAAALFCCLLLQIGANLVNDYFDSVHGIDDKDRLGPVRVTQQGLLTPAQVRAGCIFCFAAALLLGVPLAIRGGAPIIIVGLASGAAAFLYTGGPAPLSYLGMGEALAFIFFGPVAVGGTYYLQTLGFSWEAVMVGAGPGFFSALLMSVNNLRDIESDQRTGKKTVAVRLGDTIARAFSISLLLPAFLLPGAYLVFHPGRPFVLLASASILLFIRSWLKILTGPIDEKLNEVLATTGKSMFIYSLFFSLGIII